jgi:hypothetical protein
VKHFKSPFPRAVLGRFHIIFANLRQLHLIFKLLAGVRSNDPNVCDVYMVDQLSTCIPLVRLGIGRRVVFYCHFPDKLLADGRAAPTDGKRQGSLLKRIYRLPADWLEEFTTSSCVHRLNAAFAILNNGSANPQVGRTSYLRTPNLLPAYSKRSSLQFALLPELYILASTLMHMKRTFPTQKNSWALYMSTRTR